MFSDSDEDEDLSKKEGKKVAEITKQVSFHIEQLRCERGGGCEL